MNLKALSLCALALALAALTPACGDDTGGDTSSGDDGSDGSDGSDGNDTTSGSSSECNSTHECINDVCECTTPGKEGVSCDDADACDAACEVCN